jgi:DNA-directed RNA polymerase sigma subunit (sigma70/sigma32)
MSLEQLEEILNSGKIKEKDLEIVKTRYGYYNDNKPLSMQEVADIFGYSSKQTISDAEERTMKKLRSVFISPRNKKDFHIFNGYNTLK